MAREWRELNRPLRIAQYGFWENFDFYHSPLFGLFASQVPVQVVAPHQDPDVTIASVFGGHTRPSFLHGKLVMQFIGEPVVHYGAQYRWGDYFIGFEPDGPNHFHLPLWQHDMLRYDPTTRQLQLNCTPRPRETKTEYCAVFANHDNRNTRGPIFDLLGQHKEVHSFSQWRNNRPKDGMGNVEVMRGPSKMAVFDRYKFAMAVENVSEPYYLTEKLSEAMLANTVPIYWGDPCIDQSPFNPKRFLNANKLPPAELLEQVQRLDTDDELYQAMIAEPMFERPVFTESMAARSDPASSSRIG